MLCGNQRERVCYPSGRHSRAPCYCHWGRRGSYGVHPAVAAVSGTAWMGHWMRIPRWRVSVCALSSRQTPEANLYRLASGV